MPKYRLLPLRKSCSWHIGRLCRANAADAKRHFPPNAGVDTDIYHIFAEMRLQQFPNSIRDIMTTLRCAHVKLLGCKESTKNLEI
jgi:hypothetical protein